MSRVTSVSETIRKPQLVKAQTALRKQKKIKYGGETIFNMANGILTPCNVACGSGIMTVNSPSGSTLQCNRDDMPNSPKRPPYWNSTSGFISTISPQSTCLSAPSEKFLSKSDHPRQKKITLCRFSRWRISAILDFRGPIMGFLKKVKEVDLYRAFIVVPHTQSAQVLRIAQCYLQITPYLPLPRK